MDSWVNLLQSLDDENTSLLHTTPPHRQHITRSVLLLNLILSSPPKAIFFCTHHSKLVQVLSASRCCPWTNGSNSISLRSASSAAVALQGKDYTSSSSQKPSSWNTLAAATAAAVAGGSIFFNSQTQQSAAACEESMSPEQEKKEHQHHHHHDDIDSNHPLHPFYRTVSKGGIKDPMTKYQRIAILREMQLEQQRANSSGGPSIQATSSFDYSSSSSSIHKVRIAPGESDEETKSKFQRTISRGGLRDPMTTFQQRAIERALQEHEQQVLVESDNNSISISSSLHQDGLPSVQATSSSASSSSSFVFEMDPVEEAKEESVEALRKRQLAKSGIKDPMTSYQQRVAEDMEEGGLRDPMTIYQQRAIKRALLQKQQEEAEEEAEEPEAETSIPIPTPPPPPVYIQATSSVSAAGAAPPVVSTLQRLYTKSGIKDPMTRYQRLADERERREHEQEDGTAPATLQATSTRTSKLPDKASHAEEQQATHSVQATSASDQETNGGSPAAPARSFPTEMTAAEQRLEENARKAKQHSGALKLFSGNGNMSLALEITRQLGISLGKATVGRFADGEVNVVIHENVRGKDVYVVQPTCMPVNDNLMELLLIVSTLRRASARRITVVIPYYGYARQDRKMQVRSFH
jgi:N-terminal domain of ribose phosphate pyrophosphokinase